MNNFIGSLIRFVVLFLPFIKEAYTNRKDTQFGRKETNPFSMLMLEGTLLFLFFAYMSFFAFTVNQQNVRVHAELAALTHQHDKTLQALDYARALGEQTEDRLLVMTDLLEQYRLALSVEQERGAELVILVKDLKRQLGQGAVAPLPVPNQGYRRAEPGADVNRLLRDID